MYKWLADVLLDKLPPQRAAQEAAALAEPAGVAMEGFRMEQGALEQQAALHLLRKALALCPPAGTGDRCGLLAPCSRAPDLLLFLRDAAGDQTGSASWTATKTLL